MDANASLFKFHGALLLFNNTVFQRFLSKIFESPKATHINDKNYQIHFLLINKL